MTPISLWRALIQRGARGPLLITPQLSGPVIPDAYKICPIFRASVLSLPSESRELIQHIQSRALQGIRDSAARRRG